MTPAELKSIRQSLGLSAEAFARNGPWPAATSRRHDTIIARETTTPVKPASPAGLFAVDLPNKLGNMSHAIRRETMAPGLEAALAFAAASLGVMFLAIAISVWRNMR